MRKPATGRGLRSRRDLLELCFNTPHHHHHGLRSRRGVYNGECAALECDFIPSIVYIICFCTWSLHCVCMVFTFAAGFNGGRLMGMNSRHRYAQLEERTLVKGPLAARLYIFWLPQ